MKAREIKPNVLKIGAVDWDRRLFDSLIPLPDGTSYNAYLITGTDKTVLIDTVDPPFAPVLKEQLKGVRKIDFIVSNHAEQDHAGAIPDVMAWYPDAKVLCTEKAKGMLVDHLCIDESRVQPVKDGETVPLGGKTLEFIHTPWVHWPETMVTYLREDKILFPCDFFGSHIATSDLYSIDEARVYEAAKRYYAEIMMPFRTIIQKNIAKVETRPIDIIAPSHGTVHNRPKFIIDAYKDWISDAPKNEVVVPFISMHGSTRKMVEFLVNELAADGVRVTPFDLAVTDIGKLAIALVDAATIVVGVPTVHAAAHPAVVYAAYLANALRPKVKFASVIGSYGWHGKTVEQIAGMIGNLKVEVIEPVMVKGFPREKDFEALDRLADAIVKKHKELGLK
jgi:flavorubredoxin